MTVVERYVGLLDSPDLVVQRFNSLLSSIDPGLKELIRFRYDVQRHNLLDLLNDASSEIRKYEQVYPYIRDMCSNQTINPEWHAALELVLGWALSKGRAYRHELGKEIKDAWLMYIVLISCAMIDRPESVGQATNRRHESGEMFTENN